MALIQKLIEKLQRHPKRIVFPEGSDPRILQAARQFTTRRMGVPILVGDRSQIKETASQLDISLEGIRIIEPERSDDFADFVKRFENLRRYKGVQGQEAKMAMKNNNYFATMMLATNQVDAIVSGATASASSALRPLFQTIPKQDGVHTASSMLILDLDEPKLGIDGTLFLADCAVIPEPTVEQLSDIAITTARLAHHLTNALPRVAMLSYSTKSNSSRHASIARIRAAAELAREKARESRIEMEIDGEMQVDAALDLSVAQTKSVGGSVAGQANVLIFPDLNSGNITAKMVQILAGARTFGQIITGLNKPAAEISRSASAHDIFGTATIVGCQAIDHRLLYG